jgi:hypothetical protein
MGKKQKLQRLIRLYKEQTGKVEIDMHEVAEWAARMGWPLPTPKSPIDLFAKQLTEAAREEVGRDPDTGHPYRVYHAIPVSGQLNLFRYIDIREAPRRKMHLSAVNRREQMIGDGLQLTLDLRFWNKLHPDEEPIELPMDLTDDIQWRLNAPDDDEEAA